MKRGGDVLRVSAPGRVCLFGEHQDYLQLPVIPCAISLRVNVGGKRREDCAVNIALPDINSHGSFPLDQTLPYPLDRDYFRAGVNVLRKHGYSFSAGLDCLVEGAIPISAGTSSSTAVVTAWMNLLARMSDEGRPLSEDESIRLAFEAEVTEFGEPGGMMDQCSISCGGVLFVRFFPALSIERLQPPLETFVLGDSREPKATREVLSGVKNRVRSACSTLSRSYPDFSLHLSSAGEIDHRGASLSPEERTLLGATLRNRDITIEARAVLSKKYLDEERFAKLLTEEHAILRDVLCVSTPRIERMIEAALDAGALGAKINGSGGGGCMFAYAPREPERVAEAITRAGGSPAIVRPDAGVRLE